MVLLVDSLPVPADESGGISVGIVLPRTLAIEIELGPASRHRELHAIPEHHRGLLKLAGIPHRLASPDGTVRIDQIGHADSSNITGDRQILHIHLCGGGTFFGNHIHGHRLQFEVDISPESQLLIQSGAQVILDRSPAELRKKRFAEHLLTIDLVAAEGTRFP